MVSIELSSLNPREVEAYLQSAILPRPIGLVSTIDREGKVNLSPYSCFNLFSANPPIVIFSPSRRFTDNTIKHTLENIAEVPEAVIHLVDYAMVRQAELAGADYDRGINEFEKAGFTMTPASKVQPPMVQESKIKMECRVLEIKPLGTEGGAGNLVICEVLCLHIDESILDREGKVAVERLNLVACLGQDQYALINRQHVFRLEEGFSSPGIGVDRLPVIIRDSKVFTGNHLAQLASVTEIPKSLGCFGVEADTDLTHCEGRVMAIHLQAIHLLDTGNLDMAWQVLLQLVRDPEQEVKEVVAAL